MHFIEKQTLSRSFCSQLKSTHFRNVRQKDAVLPPTNRSASEHQYDAEASAGGQKIECYKSILDGYAFYFENSVCHITLRK